MSSTMARQKSGRSSGLRLEMKWRSTTTGTHGGGTSRARYAAAHVMRVGATDVRRRPSRTCAGFRRSLREQGGEGHFVGKKGVEVGVADTGFERSAHDAFVVMIIAEDVPHFVEHD